MMDRGLKTRIVTIVTLVALVNGFSDADLCSYLSYSRPMDSKTTPEIIIAQTINGVGSSKSVLCRLEKGSKKASSINHSGRRYNFKNNLAYDAHARALYAAANDVIFRLPINGSEKHRFSFLDEVVYSGVDALKNYRRRKREVGMDLGYYENDNTYFKASRYIAVAYDWATRNLFFADANKDIFITRPTDNEETERKLIHGKSKYQHDYEDSYSSSTVGKLRGVLKESKKSQDYHREKIHYRLLVHPNRGYLFVSPNRKEIIRVQQDGSNPVFIRNYKNKSSINIVTMALDYYKNRLYWLETRRRGNKSKSQICFSALHGKNVTALKINSSNSYIIPSIAVDNQFVYYAQSDHQNFSILRMGKIDGLPDLDFEIRNSVPNNESSMSFSLDEILILQPQKVTENHPCRKNYDDCLLYCVAVPDKTKNITEKCLNYRL